MIPRGQYHSIAEVDAWLNCDRVLCLICGRRFEHLGRHIAAFHHVTANEFRFLYGIPANRGLVGAKLKERFAARAVAELARDPEHRRKFVDAVRRKGYSVHPVSAAQLGDLRNKIQPMGNRARWGNA